MAPSSSQTSTSKEPRPRRRPADHHQRSPSAKQKLRYEHDRARPSPTGLHRPIEPSQSCQCHHINHIPHHIPHRPGPACHRPACHVPGRAQTATLPRANHHRHRRVSNAGMPMLCQWSANPPYPSPITVHPQPNPTPKVQPEETRRKCGEMGRASQPTTSQPAKAPSSQARLTRPTTHALRPAATDHH